MPTTAEKRSTGLAVSVGFAWPCMWSCGKTRTGFVCDVMTQVQNKKSESCSHK